MNKVNTYYLHFQTQFLVHYSVIKDLTLGEPKNINAETLRYLFNSGYYEPLNTINNTRLVDFYTYTKRTQIVDPKHLNSLKT